jgi:hypothetical protein
MPGESTTNGLAMSLAFIRGRDGLAESARAFYRRLDRAAAGRRLVVWGAGRAGEIVVELLKNVGRAPALIVDRDVRDHGERLHDIHIGPLADLLHPCVGRGDYVLLASMHALEMAAWLEGQGWQPGVDFTAFPLASIYRPEFGFTLDELPPVTARQRSASSTVHAEPIDKPTATLFASQQGNFYFRELRDFLVVGLRHAGWTVAAADEHATHIDGIPIVIGPHEFFSIGRGIEWFSVANLRAAVLVTTEQPQSLWFQSFERALALSGAVLDLSPAVSKLLTSRGVNAGWLPLGWYPDCGPFDRVPTDLEPPAGWNVGLVDGPLPVPAADRWAGRPIDILFIGSHSPRRARWIATLQEALPDANWRVHLPSDGQPIGDRGCGQIDTATCIALVRRAKVLLNLHRDDTPYFEWQRIVWRGLWQRTLVVTEPSGIVPGLAAGRDYLEVPVGQMAALLHRVLTKTAGRREAEQIRGAGFRNARAITFHDTEAALAAAVRLVGSVEASS